MLECAGPRVLGVDEVGRGPLAGPVTVAAVLLTHPIPGLNDSKQLSPARRTQLAHQIRAQASAWVIAWAGTWEIERYNILQATLRAMDRAIGALSGRYERILVDGNQALPHWGAETVVRGDGRFDVIAAASILAKVARDEEMAVLDSHYPAYGFGQHAGYPVPRHLAALRQHGVCAIHRRGFGPVAAALRAEGRA